MVVLYSSRSLNLTTLAYRDLTPKSKLLVTGMVPSSSSSWPCELLSSVLMSTSSLLLSLNLFLRTRLRHIIAEEKPEKTKTTVDTRSEKPLVFWPKTKNQMLKSVKTANRNIYRNRKTEIFRGKSRKTDLKNGQNQETENPNAPPPPPWSKAI